MRKFLDYFGSREREGLPDLEKLHAQLQYNLKMIEGDLENAMGLFRKTKWNLQYPLLSIKEKPSTLTNPEDKQMASFFKDFFKSIDAQEKLTGSFILPTQDALTADKKTSNKVKALGRDLEHFFTTFWGYCEKQKFQSARVAKIFKSMREEYLSCESDDIINILKESIEEIKKLSQFYKQ